MRNILYFLSLFLDLSIIWRILPFHNLFLYVCMYVCMYVCIYLCIYFHR